MGAVAQPAERTGHGQLARALSSRLAWPYGALVGIITVVTWPAWFTAARLIVGGDTLVAYYPWHVLMRDVVAGRESFLWNPYAFGGIPSLPSGHAGFAYPPHWLLTPLPAMLAVNWLLGLHVVLAGVGAAWCAGRLGASRDGMLLSGVTYALGSALTARLYVGHTPFVESAAWLPICLGAAVEIGRPRQICLLAVGVAMMAVTGQAELLIFSIWLLPACAVLLSLERHGWRSWLEAIRALVRTGAGLALGIGLVAFFLLPFLEFARVSNRSVGMSWEFQTGASLPPWHLATALAPLAFGDPRTGYWPGAGYEWHERLLYVGVTPLVAAFWAPDRRRLPWLFVAVLTMLLALGSYGPFFGWTQVLPGYAEMRVPPKHLIVTALALALAAGLGIERLRGVWATLLVAGLAVATFLLAGRVGWATGILLDWTGEVTRFELRQVGAALRIADRSLYLAAGLLALAAGGIALATVLRGRVGRLAVLAVAVLDLVLVLQPFRITLSDPRSIYGSVETFQELGRVAFTGPGAPYLGNYGPATRLVTPSGYQSVFGAGYMELLTGGANPGVMLFPDSPDNPALPLLGYRYVVSPDRRTVLVFEPAPPLLWVARCAWPGRARDVRAPDFPRATCITHPSATSRQEPVPAGPASLVDTGLARLRIQAEGPGWLVTTIPWYPGWRATVDGAPAPVEVVDGALVGVPLGAGDRRVELWYIPEGWEAGLACSILTAALVAVAWLADRHWRRLPPRLTAWWHPVGP